MRYKVEIESKWSVFNYLVEVGDKSEKEGQSQGWVIRMEIKKENE